MASDDLPVLRVASDVLPPPRVWSDKNPDADKRLKTARARITEVATEMSIPVENMLTPELLRRVAWNPPASADQAGIAGALTELGARGWQIDATSQVIADAFVEASQTPEQSPESES